MREVKVLKQLPWLVLFLLLAAGATLWLLFVNEQQSHLKVAFQNQMEHLSDELLRSRLEGRLGPDSLPEGIRAFGIYGPRGDNLAAWGRGAPSLIDPTEVKPGSPLVSSWDEEGRWLSFLKPLQPLRPRMNFLSENDDDAAPMDVPMGAGRRNQGFLFLTVSSAPLEVRLWAWTLGGALGAAAWAGFVVFVGVLWFRARRYQDALIQHRELLQFAEASRTLSHELQNPLAAILLQTALLKRASGGTPASEVSIIEEEAQRMSALVARVRDFLKDPKGQAEVVDLAGLADSLKERFAVPVEVAIEGSGPFRVCFDPHRLRSVVENLIKNAVESGPDPLPRVGLSKPRSGWVRLEVIDSGSGFSDAALNHALDPFFTTKTTGTGIGLSIADGFVRAAGGKLKLENRSEGGARVTLDLPEAAEEKP
jgi:signal transduction histidine kinase